MSLEDIYYITGIMAAIGVVISLVFVGLQIRQNTHATQMAAAQDVHSNFATWYRSIQGDPALAAISVKGLRDLDALSDVEKAQFVSLITAFNSNMQDAYYKWKEGSLSPELWRGWEAVSISLFGSPGGKTYWAERAYMFGATYQDHINTNVIAHITPANVRPFGIHGIANEAKEHKDKNVEKE